MTKTMKQLAQMTPDQMFNEMLTDVHARRATKYMDDGSDPGEAVRRADMDLFSLPSGDWFAGMEQPNY